MWDGEETPMREQIEVFVRMTFDGNATETLAEQVASCVEDIKRLEDPDSTTGVELIEFEILDQLRERDIVKLRAVPILLHAPMPWNARRFADDCFDDAQTPCGVLNHYCCTCGEEWTHQWVSACSDDCPACAQSVAPTSSRKLVKRNQIEPDRFQLRMTAALIAGLDLLLAEMSKSDFEPSGRMTAMGLVEPIETLDLEAFIANAARVLTVKSSKLALDKDDLRFGGKDTEPTSIS